MCSCKVQLVTTTQCTAGLMVDYQYAQYQNRITFLCLVHLTIILSGKHFDCGWTNSLLSGLCPGTRDLCIAAPSTWSTSPGDQ